MMASDRQKDLDDIRQQRIKQLEIGPIEQEINDIHHMKSGLETVLRQIKNDWSERNYYHLNKYYKVLYGAVAESSVYNAMRVLQRIERFTNKADFETMTKEQVDDLVFFLKKKYPKKENGSVQTFNNHLKEFKPFLRFILFGDRSFRKVNDPEIIKHLIVGQPDITVSKIDLLELDEQDDMIGTQTDLQNKCLVALSCELGTRSAELLTRRRKHVKFDSIGAILLATGKTGSRDIRIIRNAKYLYDWFHATKLALEVPLFIQTGARNYGKRIAYHTAKAVLKDAAKKAKVTKRVTFQINRHTAATRNSRILKDSAMKAFFGWEKRSTTPSIYTHLSGADVDADLLKGMGLESDEDDPLKLQRCKWCQTVNSARDDQCSNCSKPLNAEAALKESIEKDEEIAELKKEIAELKANKKPSKNLEAINTLPYDKLMKVFDMAEEWDKSQKNKSKEKKSKEKDSS